MRLYAGGAIMFTLLSRTSTRELLRQQLPSLVVALAIAEFFYKFHSFLLECIAFLATWFVIDFCTSRIFRPQKDAIADRQ
jgi:hypothetical protein